MSDDAPARWVDRLGLWIAAVVGAALALQLYLIIVVNIAEGTGWLTAVGRYVSFFTILSNIAVMLVLSAPLWPAPLQMWLRRATVRGAVAAYIATVGITYSLLLRQLWNPQGPQKVADIALHDIVPVLYVVFWIACLRTGTLRWRDALAWLPFPLAYLVYSLVRGPFAEWYPYPFIDVGQHGYQRVLINATTITVAFALLGLVVIAIDRVRVGRSGPTDRISG